MYINRSNVQTKFVLPIKCGKKSLKLIIEEDKLLRQYNYDYQYFYENNIITELYFISEILLGVCLFKREYMRENFRLIKKDENTKYKIIYKESVYDYKIIDISKPFNNQDDRKTKEYKIWRDKVYKRDKYTCQHCGKRGRLNAHHLKSYKEYPELRFTVENGLTLCIDCHREEHKRLRGKKNARVD